MNIEEFIHMFDDVIPYQFTLKVGGVKFNCISRNKEFISSENRKGRVYTVDKSTLLGSAFDYTPIEHMDLPIELTIECSHPHCLKWERSASSTKKGRTYFHVRILSQDLTKQYGYLSLDLTPAGDIDHKFCSFSNEDGTHEVIQSISYEYNQQTKQVIPMENLIYSCKNWENGLEERVTFYKEDGTLKGVTTEKRELKNRMYESIVWSEEKVKEQHELFSRYCNNIKVLRAIPLACDMTNYIINKDFIAIPERLKQVQSILELESNSRHSGPFDRDRMEKEIEYLSNPANDIFSTFYGEYIGNTVIKTASKLLLIVETLADGYHYFTSVDITNTNAFDIDFYHDRKEGDSYEEAILKSDKKPVFRTVIQNGEEILVPLGEQITVEERTYFEFFKSYCSDSFSAIEKKELTLLPFNRHSKKGQEKASKLVKS